jgi:hypothetical protein
MQRLAVASILLASCGAPPQSTSTPSRAALVFAVETTTRGHALVITNQTGSVQRFRRDIVVERQGPAGWEHVETTSLYLRDRCDEEGGGIYEPPACVDVAPGTFRAVPWNDMFGDAQCACEECAPAGAGTYHFVLSPCEGDAHHETEAFTL